MTPTWRMSVECRERWKNREIWAFSQHCGRRQKLRCGAVRPYLCQVVVAPVCEVVVRLCDVASVCPCSASVHVQPVWHSVQLGQHSRGPSNLLLFPQDRERHPSWGCQTGVSQRWGFVCNNILTEALSAMNMVIFNTQFEIIIMIAEGTLV